MSEGIPHTNIIKINSMTTEACLFTICSVKAMCVRTICWALIPTLSNIFTPSEKTPTTTVLSRAFD